MLASCCSLAPSDYFRRREKYGDYRMDNTKTWWLSAATWWTGTVSIRRLRCQNDAAHTGDSRYDSYLRAGYLIHHQRPYRCPWRSRNVYLLDSRRCYFFYPLRYCYSPTWEHVPA